METLAYIHMALAFAQAQHNCIQSQTGNCQSYGRQNAAYQADLYFETVNNNRCHLQIAKA